MTSHDFPNPAGHPPGDPATHACRYALRRELGVWQLAFEGGTAFIKDSPGMRRAAFLILHSPGVALHTTELLLRVEALAGGGPPGATTPMSVRQRSLGLEDAEARRAAYRRMRALETLAEDDAEPEPVREEARREADTLRDALTAGLGRSRDQAVRINERVGKSLRRLVAALARARDEAGRPHPVLRAFGEHLRRHLLAPSREAARSGSPSCFVYDPPPGAAWERC